MASFAMRQSMINVRQAFYRRNDVTTSILLRRNDRNLSIFTNRFVTTSFIPTIARKSLIAASFCTNRPPSTNNSSVTSRATEFLRNLSEKDNNAMDEAKIKKERDEKAKKYARNTYYGGYVLGVTIIAGVVYFFVYFSLPKKDEFGKAIEDEYSNYRFPYFWRSLSGFSQLKHMISEPTSDVLLPPPLPPPYFQPKYTLVIELPHVLVAPEWTYSTGYRFKKRPALAYFLDVVGYPNFEVVIYTTENHSTAHPLIDSIDTSQRIMYRLCREAHKYKNGHYIKDLSRLNRDLSKVILIDFDPNSFQLNPENVLRVPKWNGDMDDTTLVDLAELLKMIHVNNVDDVRPTLQYYSQFDDPAKEFRRRAQSLAQQQENKQSSEQEATNLAKNYTGWFGFKRHRR